MKRTALLQMILLSACASVAASLVAVWIVSAFFDLTFRPSIVTALSASASAAVIGRALTPPKHF